jgi:hypothetical protein
MVASTFATTGFTLVAMAMATPAWADYTDPSGFTLHPGTALQAGASVTVTDTTNIGGPPVGLSIVNINDLVPPFFSISGTFIAAYAFSVATGSVPLFADDSTSPDGVTDCAGESITGGGTGTIGSCVLLSSGALDPLDLLPITVAFPNVTQSATSSSGLGNGNSVTIKSKAQGDPTWAGTDSVAVEECGPMPAGVVFDVNQCVGLGTMAGTSGNYTATVPVQNTIGSTTCAGHAGSTKQCSLWTVEVHNDSTGRYWWPLANGIPISFK